MSQKLAAIAQTYESENGAKSPASARSASSVPSIATPKLRSCVVCRTRKVRCDKQSPCSNCRRAKIVCVAPSTDRPPRWAKRLERLPIDGAVIPQRNGPVDNVIGRLRKLESLVQELSGQLEQAHAAAASSSSGPSEVDSPGNQFQYQDAELQRKSPSAAANDGMPGEFGRLVLQDASHSRYISSGFWSRINDEVRQVKPQSLTIE